MFSARASSLHLLPLPLMGIGLVLVGVGVAACTASNSDASTSPAAAPSGPSGDGGTASPPTMEKDASGPTNVQLGEGPSAHLFTDLKLVYKNGPNGALERNCKNACVDKAMTCDNNTMVRHEDLTSEAVGVQVFKAFTGSGTTALALDCNKNTSDSYNKDGIGYMPVRVDCTCYAPTKLLTSTTIARCDELCKGVGLKCDDTVSWSDQETIQLFPSEQNKTSGGGRARWDTKEMGNISSATIGCDELPEKLEIGGAGGAGGGPGGGQGLPATSIECACH